MIAIQGITIRFGGVALFENISFLINKNDRIGLVGKNGAGKSTLLKVILSLQSPDEGSVTMPSGVTFGYLPQTITCNDTQSVLQEALSAFDYLKILEEQIAETGNQLAERTDYESESYLKLIERLSSLNDRYHILGGDNREGEAEKTLLGLGFERSDFERPTSEFSGGWRMRIELTKILLKHPDVLLLDEPTNHLDIESIQWLEDFLKDYSGAVVLISHDRIFLDRITNRTVEISLGKVFDYKASYSRYVELRKERRSQQMAAFENQQKKIQDTEKFIERFRYKATKSVQVQSRIKHLDKIDRIEVEDEDNASIHFRFPPAPRSGTIVVEAEKLTKKYDNHTVFQDADLIIERGQKVAFIGRNGEGKSTLVKIITNGLEHEGKLKMGHNVSIGYYAQNQEEFLDDSKTVFQTLDDVAVGDVRKQVRSILGSFLFSGETSEKKVAILSGGERSRLAMAKLLLEPYSLLVLDEPTNHLDMRSKDILKQALLQYDGTLILVSHDRDFLDGLASLVYEFRNKKIKQHIGGVAEFLEKKRMQSFKELEQKQQVKKQDENTDLTDNKKLYLQRKEYEKKIRKIKTSQEQCELRISELENLIESAEKMLQKPENIEDGDLFGNYNRYKKELDERMYEWELISHELDALEQEKEELK